MNEDASMKALIKEQIVRAACELLEKAVPLTQSMEMPWLVPAEALDTLSGLIARLRVAEGEDLD